MSKHRRNLLLKSKKQALRAKLLALQAIYSEWHRCCVNTPMAPDNKRVAIGGSMKPVWLGIFFILVYGLFSMKSQAAEIASPDVSVASYWE